MIDNRIINKIKEGIKSIGEYSSSISETGNIDHEKIIIDFNDLYKKIDKNHLIRVELNSDLPNNIIVYNYDEKDHILNEYNQNIFNVPFYNIDPNKIVFPEGKFLRFFQYTDENKDKIIIEVIDLIKNSIKLKSTILISAKQFEVIINNRETISIYEDNNQIYSGTIKNIKNIINNSKDSNVRLLNPFEGYGKEISDELGNKITKFLAENKII